MLLKFSGLKDFFDHSFPFLALRILTHRQTHSLPKQLMAYLFPKFQLSEPREGLVFQILKVQIFSKLLGIFTANFNQEFSSSNSIDLVFLGFNNFIFLNPISFILTFLENIHTLYFEESSLSTKFQLSRALRCIIDFHFVPNTRFQASLTTHYFS